MIVRRLRGALTAAMLWGLASSVTIVAFTSVLRLAGASPNPIRGFFEELMDLLPMSFGFGATSGAIFGLLLAMAERNQTLASLSERRFRTWGILAGAIPMAAFEAVHHSSLASGGYAIFCGAFTGAVFAPALLRTARRSASEVV